MKGVWNLWRRAKQPASPPSPVERYLASGRKPWSEGYEQYKAAYIGDVLRDDSLLGRFRRAEPLPAGYGFRLDERAVEYPWVLARLAAGPGRLLDAGATLAFAYLRALPMLNDKLLVVYTLEAGPAISRLQNVSYICGDLRDTILKDGVFEEIVCISTLEHIGMDNTQLYTADERYRESRPHDYRLALREFQRLLTPGGRLFVTVPYGVYQRLGWLQQFDQAGVEDFARAFGGRLEDLAFYRYRPEGWQRAAADECQDCRYFDIHRTPEYESDYAAAARAVACLELSKT